MLIGRSCGTSFQSPGQGLRGFKIDALTPAPGHCKKPFQAWIKLLVLSVAEAGNPAFLPTPLGNHPVSRMIQSIPGFGRSNTFWIASMESAQQLHEIY